MMMTAVALLKKNPRPDRRSRSAGASPATCAAARATSTSSRPSSTRRRACAPRRRAAAGRGQSGRITKWRPRHRRHVQGWPQRKRGRSALPPRQGQLHRRHQAARHALPGHRAQPVRARQDQEDQRRTGAGDPRRAGGDHRQGPRAVQPALDADADARHRRWCCRSTRSCTRPRRSRRCSPPSRYVAADGVAAVEVDYEPLPVVVDPIKALEPDAPMVRDDRGQKSNHIWHWECGRQARRPTGVFTEADVMVEQDIYIPRIHVSSIETCGCVAQFDRVSGKLHGLDDHAGAARHPHGRSRSSPAPGLEEHKIRIISPDIGGGFGGKVPVYPGYVIAVAASWSPASRSSGSRTASENLQADSFARDYHINAELAAKQGRHDHRAAHQDASPTTATPTPRRTRPSSRPGCSTSAPARTT